MSSNSFPSLLPTGVCLTLSTLLFPCHHRSFETTHFRMLLKGSHLFPHLSALSPFPFSWSLISRRETSGTISEAGADLVIAAMMRTVNLMSLSTISVEQQNRSSKLHGISGNLSSGTNTLVIKLHLKQRRKQQRDKNIRQSHHKKMARKRRRASGRAFYSR